MAECQCDYCLQIMQVPAAAAGRKILCPLCGDPMTVPKPGDNPRFKKFVLRDAIDKFKYTEWDREFARAVLVQGKLPEKTLSAAIGTFMKASRKNSDLTLATHIQNQGLLAAGDISALRKLVKGAAKPGATPAATQFVQCPNCFANVDPAKRSCKFCGQRLTDQALVTCPACKHEQEKKEGGRVCVRCKANLQTGLKEKVQRCPGCNGVVYGDPTQCPHCQAILKTASQIAAERRAEGERAQKKKVRKKVTRIAAAAGILLLAILAWFPIRALFRTMSVGSAQSSLEDRLKAFSKTLTENNPDALAPFLAPELRDMAPADRLRLVCTGQKKGAAVKSINSVTPLEIEMSEDEKSAFVTSALKIVLDHKESGAASAFIRPKTYTAEWYWVRKDGNWLLSTSPQREASPATQ